MRLVILYGSQTGTAKDLAEQIWRESKQWRFDGPVLPMDDFPYEQLIEERYVVFVVSTTGSGVEPDNMSRTWRFLLRRALPSDCLAGMKFACLGLGDSSYDKYNYAAKKLFKRLDNLQAKPILPLGLCDEQHDNGIGAAALPWIAELWVTLSGMLELTRNDMMACRVFKWRCEIIENSQLKATSDSLGWPYREKSMHLRVKRNIRTTTDDHFQDVRLLQFDWPHPTFWNTGDILRVHPCNPQWQVDEFFSIMSEHNWNFRRDTLFQVTPEFDEFYMPHIYSQPLTVEQAVRHVFDLNFKPRQRAFELLALRCEDDNEQDKLWELTTPAGLNALMSYVNRPKRTLLEVLRDFPHATSKLTLRTLVELFPVMQIREFSIASIPASGTLDLLIAVVNYKTSILKPRLGVCSNWLKSLRVGDNIITGIKRGIFSLPRDVKNPLIMIGPGTGISPFRSMIQYRLNEKAKDEKKLEYGPMHVYFGCRSNAKDFHFQNDLLDWDKNKDIDLRCAFSRDQDHKIYVQHLIKEDKSILRELIIEKSAYVYVAGSSTNMPRDVQKAILYVLDDDEDYLKKMFSDNRYQEETWS